MAEQTFFGAGYGGSPPANYERYFVPAIGAPVAAELVRRAGLRRGERVLDVACGTGVVARLASQQVGEDGTVVGLDVNPGMLAVARAVPDASSITWHQASADAMPLADASFDVVLCQMGLQFMPDRNGALREMRRVLAPDGHMLLNLPGPAPRVFAAMGEAFARNVSGQAAAFVTHVFALHDEADVQRLVRDAGFNDVAVGSETMRLPLPDGFLWQYVQSTPLAGEVAKVDGDRRASLEHDVAAAWDRFAAEDDAVLEVRVVTATARA